MRLKTPLKRVLFVRDPKLMGLGVLCVLAILIGLFRTPVPATAATDSTVNFQARLMTGAGAIVPDGSYNVEFKLYNALTSSGSSQGSCTGDAACLWTETRTSGNKVTVQNGYLTVNLGSVTAFPTTINWDQDLYISLNIGGTGTPGWDGEMTPRLHLTAVPYAFRAGQLAQYNSSTGFTSTLNIVQPTGGNQVFNIPDQGAAGTYNLLTTNAASTGFVQLQASTPGTAQTGNLNISGVGIAGTSLQSPLLDTPSGTTTLNIGTNNATAGINLNQNVTVASGKSLTVQGAFTQSNGAYSLTGTAASSLTTSSGGITITAAGTSNWTVGGTNQSLTITTSGTGVLTLGTTGAGTVTLGSSSATINLGITNNAHAVHIADAGTSTTQSVTIGSKNTGSTTLIQGGTTASAINLTTGVNGSINLDASAGTGGINLKTNGTTIVAQTLTNSTSAFQVQNNTGGYILNVDTSNSLVNLGFLVVGVNGLQPTIDTYYTSGTLAIGGTNATTIALGNSTAATSVTLQGGTGSSAIAISAATNGSINLTTTGTGKNNLNSATATIVKSTTNAVTAFQVQNTSSVGVFDVDTTNGRVGIGNNAPTYALDVVSDINTTTNLRIAGTIMCDSTGCTAKTGSGFYIHNQTTVQSANMYVQAATSGTVAATLQANASGSGDILDLKNGSGANVATFSSTGAVNFQNSTDSTNAFKIQNAAGSSILSVDNTNNVISLNAGASLSGNSGTWSTASTLPVSYDGASSVTVNGYVYYIGGYDGTNYVTDVYYAKASANGTTGTWRAAASLPGNRAFASAVAVNGYIYLMGGNNAGTYNSTVYFTKVNTDGTLGTWASTTALPQIRAYGAATTANGYIYFVGGRGTAGAYQSTVYYAAPSSATGAISSWSTGTALPALRAQEVTVTANNYLYVMGGTPDGSTYSNAIYSTTINASTGATGASWTTLGTTIPSANMADATAVAANGYVYISGGYNGSTITSSVAYATLIAGGTTGTFASLTNALPSAVNYGASTAVNGYLYVLGGYTGSAFINSVYSAPLQGLVNVTGNVDVSGSVSFQNTTNSQAAFQVQNAAGDMLFNVDTTNNVVTLNSGVGGALNAWRQTSSLSATTSFSGATIANGYAYVIGGYGSGYTANVQYAPINNDGTMGTWSTTTALPANRGYVAAASTTGYMYAIGGTDGSANQNTIYIAKQNADGTVGAWQASSVTLPASLNAMSVAISNGYMYILGGTTGTAQTAVYYTHLNGDGSINTFTTSANPLPTALANASVVIANGYIYYVGGYTGSASVSTIYYSALSMTGGNGAWTSTTPLPAASSNFGATVANGKLYIFRNGTAVYYATLNADGTVGAFSTDSNSLPVSYTGMSALTYNGYMYVLGGYTGSVGTTGVYYTSGARTLINGTLDLVGLSSAGNMEGDTSQSTGSVGGALIAGNTTVVGTLQVQGQATFNNNLNINGNSLTVGNDADSTSGSTVITVESKGYSGLELFGDSTNASGEPGGAYVLYSDDGMWGTYAITGMVQGAGTSPLGGTYTNTLANAFFIGGFLASGSNPQNGAVQFGTAGAVRMTILGSGASNAGDICINATTCTHTLGVSGTIAASGAITANGTPDLAETIPAAADVGAADVVMADPNNTERVIKSNGAYNSTVMGVISDGTSSFMINAHGDSESAQLTGKPMVLAGRVPVKVTNEGGDIKPGDYLTSSSTPGYAMKATHAGPTVGKALGYFNGDKGTVLTLVNVSYYDPGTSLQGDTSFQAINVSGDVLVGGDLTVKGATSVGDIVVNGHIITAGETPQIEVQDAAGQDAKATIVGNDTSGVIVITAGDQATADDLVKIIFSKAFGSSPSIVITPVGKDSASKQAYVDQTSTKDFMLGVLVAPENGKTYTYNYHVLQ